METLVHCQSCGHGATVHETTGCTYARCGCVKGLSSLVDEALETARNEIRREWRVAG